LRELALRFLADETDDELLDHLRHRQGSVWETCERLVVAVTGAPGTDGLMRRAARMAARLKGPLDVVHVTATDATTTGQEKEIAAMKKLADDLDVRWHDLKDDDPARAIAEFARRNQITQIIIGSSRRRRWQQLSPWTSRPGPRWRPRARPPELPETSDTRLSPGRLPVRQRGTRR
jgi:two-component system, OmpR family, sensor histidine kinase KdpD